MGRVIAVGRGGKAQAPERSDEHHPVIEYVHDNGMLDQLLLSPACRTFDDADQVRQGIFRSARYYCSCGRASCTRKHSNYPVGDKPGGCPHGGQRVSARAEVVTVTAEDGKRTYHVQFQLHDKREAIRAFIQKYGPDPDKWPYNPRARKLRREA